CRRRESHADDSPKLDGPRDDADGARERDRINRDETDRIVEEPVLRRRSAPRDQHPRPLARLLPEGEGRCGDRWRANVAGGGAGVKLPERGRLARWTARVSRAAARRRRTSGRGRPRSLVFRSSFRRVIRLRLVVEELRDVVAEHELEIADRAVALFRDDDL